MQLEAGFKIHCNYVLSLICTKLFISINIYEYLYFNFLVKFCWFLLFHSDFAVKGFQFEIPVLNKSNSPKNGEIFKIQFSTDLKGSLACHLDLTYAIPNQTMFIYSITKIKSVASHRINVDASKYIAIPCSHVAWLGQNFNAI